MLADSVRPLSPRQAWANTHAPSREAELAVPRPICLTLSAAADYLKPPATTPVYSELEPAETITKPLCSQSCLVATVISSLIFRMSNW